MTNNQDDLISKSGTKTTIKTSSSGKETIDVLKKYGYFGDATDCFRFCVAYGIKNNLLENELVTMSDNEGYTWSTITVDPEPYFIRTLVEQIYNKGIPMNHIDAYKTAELLAESALNRIKNNWEMGDRIGTILSEI
jgi:hypothetical protein